MKQTTYTTRVIKPEEGFYLTQSEEVEVINRIFSKEIYLAANDSPDNYTEISEQEANIIMAQQEELRKLEMPNPED